MQEWIIAMLAVSILLILRDMAKTVLKGRKSKKEEPFPMNGEHPQKERVEQMCIRDRCISMKSLAVTGRDLIQAGYKPVSYTHLDVYKRQLHWCMESSASLHTSNSGEMDTNVFQSTDWLLFI